VGHPAFLTFRDHRKNAPPISLYVGAMNGSGINQNATLAEKSFFAGVHYNAPRLEGRLWAESGEFRTAAPSAVMRGPRQRVAASVRANFLDHADPDDGQYGYRLSLMAAWAQGRGDFPGRNGVNGAGLLTSGTLIYTPNRVGGWYLEPVAIVTTDPIPVRLIGRYEVFDTNRNASFSKIFQGFAGVAFDATRHARFIVGYTPKIDQTLGLGVGGFRQHALTLETQLAF
jgi:hypothetical protein